jgi:hypothetical protein
MGNKRISSTSKTRNTNATKKNRKDKGVRGNDLGVKPHSKGLAFSRSKKDFILTLKLTKTNTAPKIIEIRKKEISLSKQSNLFL